jgi:hypothetical protein
MSPEAGLSRCRPHSGEWHDSRSWAGGAVFLSGRLVERRSDCGHFGSVDWRARVRVRCQAILALNGPAIWSVGVAIWPRLLLWRADGVSVAWGGPRARREPSGVGCLCPRLGSGEARSCPLSGLSLDLNRAHQAFAALCWWGLPAEIRSLGGTPNYGPRQTQSLILPNYVLFTEFLYVSYLNLPYSFL